MNPIRTISSYLALNPAQKKILREKRLEMTMPPDAWIDLLEEISLFDRHGDATRKLFGGLAIFLVVLLFLGAILVGNGAVDLPRPELLFGTLGALLLLCAIGWAVLRGQDMHNNLRLFVLPLITVLREEMDAKEKLALEMDFRGAESKEKEVDDKVYHPAGGSYPRIHETHYRDPWLIGKARLADGGSLEWRIEDLVRKRKIRKRNPRGKIKFKTKYKVKRCIKARLSLGRKRYQLTGSGGQSEDGNRVEVRETDKRNAFKVQRVVVSDKPGTVLDIHEFLDLLAGVYRRVRPASKKEGGSS